MREIEKKGALFEDATSLICSNSTLDQNRIRLGKGGPVKFNNILDRLSEKL